MLQIAILGIDGAGKTTLGTNLAGRLTELGRTSVIKSRRKVLGGKVYDALKITKEMENARQVSPDRAVAFCTAMYLDFAEDVSQTGLNRGPEELVIWDRHVRCLSAYARTLSVPAAWALDMETMVARPDLSFWLDTPVSTAYERLCRRADGGGRETPEYLRAYREAYAELCGPDSRVVRTDGATPMAVLVQQIIDVVKRTRSVD